MLIFTSDLLKKLQDWASMDIPLKEIKKQHNEILICRSKSHKAILLHPIVISNNPLRKALIQSLDMENGINKENRTLVKTWINPKQSKSLKKTEKIITKPPIIRIVLIASFTDSPKIKEKSFLSDFFLWTKVLILSRKVKFELLFIKLEFAKFLKTIPRVNAPR